MVRMMWTVAVDGVGWLVAGIRGNTTVPLVATNYAPGSRTPPQSSVVKRYWIEGPARHKRDGGVASCPTSESRSHFESVTPHLVVINLAVPQLSQLVSLAGKYLRWLTLHGCG